MSDSKPATSRRRLLQGASACALPVPTSAAADPALALAKQWCALETEQRRLIRQWQGVEAWLFQHCNWPRLSETERDAVPEAAQLHAIDDQLAGIDAAYDTLLPQLKTIPATTRAGLLARFDALLWFLDETDHPDARALLRSCQSDLRRLWIA